MASGNANDPTPASDISPEQMDKTNAPENDVFRQVYIPLNEEQTELGKIIKEKAQELWDAMGEGVPDGERSERARLVSIGKTQLELAVMAAIKGVFSTKL